MGEVVGDSTRSSFGHVGGGGPGGDPPVQDVCTGSDNVLSECAVRFQSRLTTSDAGLVPVTPMVAVLP
jgi:hypothetical protein